MTSDPFDNGGTLPPGTTEITNATGEPIEVHAPPTLAGFLLARLAEDEADVRQCIFDREPGVGNYDLAEIALKRRIVNHWPDPTGQWNAAEAEAARTMKNAVLLILAAPYARHRDYRQEWNT